MLGEYLEATTSYYGLLSAWPQGRVLGTEYPNLFLNSLPLGTPIPEIGGNNDARFITRLEPAAAVEANHDKLYDMPHD
jgi:hypothetical protein